MATTAVFVDKNWDREVENLFRKYCQLIYRTAYGITRDYGDADDVLQSIFLKLLQGELSPDLMRNPGAYLHRAAVNQSLNLLRSRGREQEKIEVEDLEIPQESSEAFLSERRHEWLMDAISSLKPQAIEILMLHYKQNYSDAAIAKLLGKSRGTVAVTLYRIRARLKRLLSAAAAKEGQQ